MDDFNRTRVRSPKLVQTSIIPRPILRVLLVSATGELGGAEYSFLEMVKALPRERVEPHVCVPPDSPLHRMSRSAKATVHPIPLRAFRRSLNPLTQIIQLRTLRSAGTEIAKICREHRIHLLHGNTEHGALLCWEATRNFELPYVWHCRDMRPMNTAVRVLTENARCAIAISSAVETHLKNEGVPPSKIKRIVNGIDLKRVQLLEDKASVRSRMRASLGISKDQPVVISIGQYVPWKKHELFLEALHALRAKQRNVVGLLVGSDKYGQNAGYAAALKSAAARLGLGDDRLHVLDERHDIPELLAASDILISCSDNEPFGRVLAEAGGAGVPVIATNSGAKAEIIKDQATGILTPTGNRDAIVNACMELIGNPEKRAQMGVLAKLRIERDFDIQRVGKELADLYDSICPVREPAKPPELPPSTEEGLSLH